MANAVNHPSTPEAEARRQYFLELYQGGSSVRKISIQEKISDEWVRQILIKAGYTRRPPKHKPTKSEKEQYRINNRIIEFWTNVKKAGPDDCWEWTGACRTKFGYGRFSFRFFDEAYAHRITYIVTHGKIPDDLDVLHSCDNPSCCNPNHLHLGTQADNNKERDTRGRGKIGIKKDYCLHGHPMSGDNLIFFKNSKTGKYTRHCRECVNIYSRKSYATCKLRRDEKTF